MRLTITGIFLVITATGAFAMDPATCPMHEQHMKAAAARGDSAHGAEVDSRHDSLVASHEVTRHTFRLLRDGGAIELRANDPADAATVAAVRAHLRTVAEQFSKNDFTTPAFVHGREPAGIEGMQRMHDAISFRFEELPGGGRIRMKTASPEAIAAIHEFMKFQIVEHRTSDPAEVGADR